MLHIHVSFKSFFQGWPAQQHKSQLITNASLSTLPNAEHLCDSSFWHDTKKEQRPDNWPHVSYRCMKQRLQAGNSVAQRHRKRQKAPGKGGWGGGKGGEERGRAEPASSGSQPAACAQRLWPACPGGRSRGSGPGRGGRCAGRPSGPAAPPP